MIYKLIKSEEYGNTQIYYINLKYVEHVKSSTYILNGNREFSIKIKMISEEEHYIKCENQKEMDNTVLDLISRINKSN